MKKFFTLREASEKISNLCTAIGNLDACYLGSDPDFVSDVLQSGHKTLWIGKLSGLLYFKRPLFTDHMLVLHITSHDDKYEIELV